MFGLFVCLFSLFLFSFFHSLNCRLPIGVQIFSTKFEHACWLMFDLFLVYLAWEYCGPCSEYHQLSCPKGGCFLSIRLQNSRFLFAVSLARARSADSVSTVDTRARASHPVGRVGREEKNDCRPTNSFWPGAQNYRWDAKNCLTAPPTLYILYGLMSHFRGRK